MKQSSLFLLTTLLVLLCCSLITAQNFKPEQIRVELTGTDNEVTIIYTTGSSTNSDYKVYTTVPAPQLWWGATTSPATLVKGSTLHYEYNGYRADIHSATIKGLTAGTKYYYKVGDTTKTNGVSDVFSFKAGNPKTWAVYGDYGLTNMDQALTELLNGAKSGKEYDGVLHLGDIAYDLHNQKGAKGDIFMNTLQPITANYPYMSIVGNHESNGNFSHFSNRFHTLDQLGKKSKSDTLLWFSWNAPNVHFVVFDTEVYSYFSDPAQIQRQLDWLRKDLELYNTPTNRKKYPWIITLGHKCDWQDEVKFEDFRNLFHEMGVDLHICGHQHNYQRLYPGLKRTIQAYDSPNLFIDPKYWTQMVVGSPGCQEKISSGIAPYKGGVASYFLSYGYGLLTVHNSTHVEWKWKQTNVPASSENGETRFDKAILAFLTEEDRAKHYDVGAEIKDHMMLIQTAHGKRSMKDLQNGLKMSAILDEFDQIHNVYDRV
jgi:alkaline phosphatase D